MSEIISSFSTKYYQCNLISGRIYMFKIYLDTFDNVFDVYNNLKIIDENFL